MALFYLYLLTGINHIADLQGYDHILFIITLCAVYDFRHWKQVLILTTAFTLGHSITLVLATLNIVQVPTDIIEFLIPVTIFLTGLGNVFQKKHDIPEKKRNYKYPAAMLFGLIHGMGFKKFTGTGRKYSKTFICL